MFFNGEFLGAAMSDSRRRYLAGLAGAIGTLVAGCTGPADGDAETTETTGTTQTTETTTGTGPAATVARADGAWRAYGGTPEGTGATVDPGPGAGAARDWTAAFGEHRTARERGTRPTVGQPLVDDDGVYAVSRLENYDADPASFGLYAQSFAAGDGSERWERALVRKDGEESSNHVRSFAAGLGADALYVWVVTTSRYEHELVSLSLADGTVRWRASLPELAGATTAFQPQVVGDACYLYTGARVHALSTADGSVRWRSERYRANSVVPAVTEDVVAFTTRAAGEDNAPGVVALSTDDGAERWRAEREHGIPTRPVIAGDAVHVTDAGVGAGGPVLSDAEGASVYAFALSDGSERWRRDYVREGMTDGDQFGGPGGVAVGEDRLYYAFGVRGPYDDDNEEQFDRQYDGPSVVAVDRATGDREWAASPTDRSRFFHPPVLADGTLYCLHSGDGSVYALDAADGTVTGSFGEFRSDRSFAVVDGTVYERTEAGFRAWR